MKNYLDLLNEFNNTPKPVESEKTQEIQKPIPPSPVLRPRPEIKKVESKPKIEDKKVEPAPPKKSRFEQAKEQIEKEKTLPRQEPTQTKIEPTSQPTINVKTFTRPIMKKPDPALTPAPKVESRKAIDYPKISIIMQTYLGDYPGSRINSELKFKRAIASFIKQTYENCELIIVSDGCSVTHNLWINEIQGINRIKYAYVDKSGYGNMYEKDQTGEKIYRGIPRAVGVTIATGDIITYCDSDDFMLPYFCEMLVLQHRANPNSDWMVNSAWFDHEAMITSSAAAGEVLKSYENARVLNSPFSKDYKFVESRVKEGFVVNTPWLLAHMSSCEVKWEDSKGGVSEDTLFGRKLRSKYPTGHVYSSPTYLRCHYSGLWDV